jgi:hypothetical protein
MHPVDPFFLRCSYQLFKRSISLLIRICKPETQSRNSFTSDLKRSSFPATKSLLMPWARTLEKKDLQNLFLSFRYATGHNELLTFTTWKNVNDTGESVLKGQCHEILDFRIFHDSNSRRYSQLKVHHRCR